MQPKRHCMDHSHHISNTFNTIIEYNHFYSVIVLDKKCLISSKSSVPLLSLLGLSKTTSDVSIVNFPFGKIRQFVTNRISLNCYRSIIPLRSLSKSRKIASAYGIFVGWDAFLSSSISISPLPSKSMESNNIWCKGT